MAAPVGALPRPRKCQIYTPSTSAELTAVLFEARPGDVIQLLPQDYIGQFTLGPLPVQFQPIPNINGEVEEQLPIIITGSRSSEFQRFTTIVSRRQPHKAIQITGGKWVVSGLIVKSKYHWDFKQIGIEITSDGHTIRDVIFNQDRTGLIINGNNNLVENARFNNCMKAISILGQGNVIKDAVLSRIKDDGIVLEPNSAGNRIETTVIHMKRNVARKNEGRFGRRNRKVNDGRSLHFKVGSMGTRVTASTFYGISNINADNNGFTGCKFLGVNLGGTGNDFSDTEITTLYRHRGAQNNTLQPSCRVGGQVNKTVKFE